MTTQKGWKTMALIIDIFLVASLIVIIKLGWSAGFTRSFFAAFAGFAAIFAASKYPFQEGANFYLVFIITALLLIAAGGFILRLVKFFYMNDFDKAAGAVLGGALWIIVCVNVIVPTLTYGTSVFDGENKSVFRIVSNGMHSYLPSLKEYVPPFLETKYLRLLSENEQSIKN